MKELLIEASVDKLDEVQAFVEGNLEESGCPMNVMMQVEVAVEEIFVNIASYAYPKGSGSARICMDARKKELTMVFEDLGVPFDPLAKADPDTDASAEERSIGGLGIYLVKKTMDEVNYRYEDGKNILSIIKTW